MRFRILGPLEVQAGPDDELLTPRATKPRVLLGALLVRADETVSVEDLVDELWPTAPPRTATTTLQVYVSQLRKLLRAAEPTGAGDRLLTTPPGYSLRTAPGALDSTAFEELLGLGQQAMAEHEFASAAELYRQAVGLWRGPVLSDVPHGLVLRQAARRLDELRVSALVQRVRADLRLGRHRELVAELRSLVADHPLREDFHGQLMTAFYRSGRQAEALQVFAELRKSLVAELGMEPGPRLRQLQLRILEGDPALLHGDGGDGGQQPPVRLTTRPMADRLPAADPLFTARSGELAELERLLRTGAAAVAVTGQPGVGKTALAVEASHRLADAFPDGRIFLDLQPEGRPPLEPAEAVARLTGHSGGPDAEAVARTLHGLLAGRRVLLVLDDAASESQLRPLLPATPGSAALVTIRRRPTGVGGLRTLALGGFGPGDSRLLLLRAAETVTGAGPEGRPEGRSEAWAELAELCGHLPLALRIAADQLATRTHRSAAWLAAQLREERGRLDWLHSGGLDLRGRLLAAYRSCTVSERRTFRLLGLLPPGGFGLRTAAPVLGLDPPAALRALEELVDANLVEAALDEYRLSSLLRLFAAERLTEEEPPGETRDAVARMCTAFAEEAEQAAPAAAGWSVPWRETLVRIARTAHEAGLWELTVRLADALAPRLERDAAWTDWESTHHLALDAAERCADLPAQARLLRSLGDLAWQRRRTAHARDLYGRAGAAARAAADSGEYGRALVGLAELRLDAGAVAEAAQLLEPALAAVQGPANGRARYEANRAMALLALDSDAPAAAEGYFALCLELAAVLQDRRLEVYARRSLRALRSTAPGVEVRPGVWRLRPAPGG